MPINRTVYEALASESGMINFTGIMQIDGSGNPTITAGMKGLQAVRNSAGVINMTLPGIGSLDIRAAFASYSGSTPSYIQTRIQTGIRLVEFSWVGQEVDYLPSRGTWNKDTQDALAADVQEETIIWRNPSVVTLSPIWTFVSTASPAVTPDATDFAQIILRRYNVAGALQSTNIYETSTAGQGGGTPLPILPFSSTNLNLLSGAPATVAYNETVTLEIDKQGTGVVLPPFHIDWESSTATNTEEFPAGSILFNIWVRNSTAG